jgi:murein DD-endopeptidase MepM/ murein hydrolase activator NlpD
MKKFIFMLLLTNCLFAFEPFMLPLPKQFCKVSSGQGLRDALTKEQAGASTAGLWHNGLDFPCPEGTSVYAAKSGIVTCVYPSYYNGGKLWNGHKVYGGLIIIEHHDGTISLYGHLSLTEVLEGDVVYVGQRIGKSGGIKGKRGSGTSTGPHLHFSVYIDLNNVFVNFE